MRGDIGRAVAYALRAAGSDGLTASAAAEPVGCDETAARSALVRLVERGAAVATIAARPRRDGRVVDLVVYRAIDVQPPPPPRSCVRAVGEGAPGLVPCGEDEAWRRDDCRLMARCLAVVALELPEPIAARCPRDCSRYAPTPAHVRHALAVAGRVSPIVECEREAGAREW